ncbi:hypothetical protein CUJ86_03595 [Methanofollis fontis]|uniref:S-layer protein C-terminal domain-containing protein n=1 Tax=Methanofollis fontis TaxID=2052832 RepID=A0A483CTS3_9EURY|nr:hypothetical protein CUJ86_03595 [Methanofollis fontis]
MIIAGGVLCLILLCGCIEEGTGKPPDLSDMPKVMAGDVLIITGDDFSEVEATAVDELAAYLNGTGEIHLDIVAVSVLNRTDLQRYHLIVIGTPGTNPLVGEVAGVVGGDEGEGRLILLENPWNPANLTLVVTGSDAWGVRAAGEMLQDPGNLSGADMTIESRIISMKGRISQISFGSTAAWVVWGDDGEIYLLQGAGAEGAIALGEGVPVVITGYPTTTTLTIPEGGEMNRHRMKAIEVIRAENT